MQLHHRAIIRGRNVNDIFYGTVYDIGFPWGTKWEDSEKVMKLVNEMKARYQIVDVDVTDAGG